MGKTKLLARDNISVIGFEAEVELQENENEKAETLQNRGGYDFLFRTLLYLKVSETTIIQTRAHKQTHTRTHKHTPREFSKNFL